MSSNYSPWETADSAGGDLTGTMTTDRASGPSYNDIFSGQVNPVQTQEQAPPDPIASLGQLQAQWQAQTAQSEPFFRKLTFNPEKGTVDISTSQGALAEVMGQLTDLKTMKAAAMARVAQLRQQESSGSPILDALSQFAGNMAQNDPTMPGWVRALGATNLQMGPQGIKKERMAEEQKALVIGKEITDTAMDAAKFDQTVQQAGQMNYLKAAELSRKVMDDAKTDSKDFAKLMGRVSTEVRSLRDFDPETFAVEAKALGASDEQVAAGQDKFLTLAAMTQQKYALEQKVKSAEFSREEQAKLNRQAISIGAAMERVLTSKDIAAVGAANKLDMKDEDFLSSARAYDQYLQQAKAAVEEYKDVMGPVAGRMAKYNPWRRAKAQEAMSKIGSNLQRFMQSNGESIARGSDRDMKLFERLAADITSTPEQAIALLDQQQETIKQKLTGVIEVNPYADWRGRYGVVVPEWARPVVDDTLKRASSGPGMALPSGAKKGGMASEADAAKKAKIGSTVTIGGAKYKKVGENDYEPVQVN